MSRVGITTSCKKNRLLNEATAYVSALLLLSVVLTVAYLYLGIFSGREFAGEYHLFVKHRPSIQFYFYSPVGYESQRFYRLPPRERDEEDSYREFVETNEGYSKVILKWSSPW